MNTVLHSLPARIAIADQLGAMGVTDPEMVVAALERAETSAERFACALRALRPLSFTAAGVWDWAASNGYVGGARG